MRRDSTLTCLDAVGRGDCNLTAHAHTTLIVEVEMSLSHLFHHLLLRPVEQSAVWSSGMILAQGARGPGPNSWNSPQSASQSLWALRLCARILEKLSLATASSRSDAALLPK